jgi:hypothetical protein
MAALTGLTGLATYQEQINEDAQASPEARNGGVADPRHGNWGEQAAPYPWESSIGMGGSHGPYGLENGLLGDESWIWQPAGNEAEDPTMDITPVTRAAPSPKGILSGPIPSEGPDDIAEQLRQSAEIHAVDTHGSRRATYPPLALVQNDEWETVEQVNPGHSDLQALPRQAMSSGFMFGTTDRTQSFARQNEYGFDSAHQHRRFATGPIPGNTYWMKPGGRPLAKSLPGPARPPIGVDSPFAGQDMGQAFSPSGAILMDQPTEYTPPPQPYLAPASQTAASDSVVEWY